MVRVCSFRCPFVGVLSIRTANGNICKIFARVKFHPVRTKLTHAHAHVLILVFTCAPGKLMLVHDACCMLGRSPDSRNRILRSIFCVLTAESFWCGLYTCLNGTRVVDSGTPSGTLSADVVYCTAVQHMTHHKSLCTHTTWWR